MIRYTDIQKKRRGLPVNKRKTRFKRTIVMICLFFVLIVCAFLLEITHTNHYNQTERTTFGAGEVCNVEIYPRGGKTDSWSKNMDGKEDYLGVIYEGFITNSGKYDMSEWSLRVNIENDMYINNAWCGKVEIHQMGKDSELI